MQHRVHEVQGNIGHNGAILCLWELSKTGSECSSKLEVLQDSAFETNVYEVNFQMVYLLIDLIFPIRCSVHFSYIRLSSIVLYPLKSDAVTHCNSLKQS